MASTQTKTGAPTLDIAFDQVKRFNEPFLRAAGQAGTLYLDAYEKAVDEAIELELKVAGQTQQEWLKNLIEAQADSIRQITTSYARTARSLLK